MNYSLVIRNYMISLDLMPQNNIDKNASSPWSESEKNDWFTRQCIQRSYLEEVLTKLESLGDNFELLEYGVLSVAKQKYPLFLVRVGCFSEDKPSILITGGVHGYETSGVQGAIRFLQQKAQDYSEWFNIVVAPCVSPWGYETINRWNNLAIDPNRSFYAQSPAQESALLMRAIDKLGIEFFAHFDLHETTDTDNTVFLPDLAKRDATELTVWEIPDGFYLVGDVENPQGKFQSAIISSVEKVTHIAPQDSEGNIIGEPITQKGVINYAVKKLGLCAGITNAEYCTTTEVYPDSPHVSDEECILAQVAAVEGGLDYLVSQI
ncbi:MAG: M14 family metallocarboxypeptidase [Kangiellaceae bacterium]|nr:M14 family metallocarboxypeptidase [Kangiellaceae bacterium]MCW9016795.1 M14 family metallocarboxypeptidase [Kangiellaceae bacterium]